MRSFLNNFFLKKRNQEKIALDFMPRGKIYNQAKIEGSNFNKIIKWISNIFFEIIEEINKVYKGFFISQSKDALNLFKRDYGIPNNIFYEAGRIENGKDIYALKYLTKGNTKESFQKVANLYNADALIEDISTNPTILSNTTNRFPLNFFKGIKFSNLKESDGVNFLFITLITNEEPFPYKFPIKFGRPLTNKIKNIFDLMRPAQVKIFYKTPIFSIAKTKEIDYLESKIPLYLVEKEVTKIIFEKIGFKERFKFPKNLNKF